MFEVKYSPFLPKRVCYSGMAAYCYLNDKFLQEGERHYCAPLAVSLVSGVPATEVNEMMIGEGFREKGKGTSLSGIETAMKNVGLKMKRIKKPVEAKTAKSVVKALDKNKKYLILFKGHIAALIGGELCDYYAGRRFKVIGIYEVGSK